ncbi:MAG: OmpA family protein [Gammaproteobacteria bacterium]|nr:OmpA family protein [Gammaproteobacteria bacterium]MDH5729087.1 OmpA family protein [Gammaproteobacteria bacterium]
MKTNFGTKIFFIMMIASLGACSAKKNEKIDFGEQQPVEKTQPELVKAEPIAIEVFEPQVQPVPIEESVPQPPELSHTIWFDTNSTIINSQHEKALRLHSQFLTNNPQFKIVLQGHADERGSDEFNYKLGLQRSLAIKAALLARGVTDNQISVESYGEKQPVVMQSDERAWAQNRRAVLLYPGISASATSGSEQIILTEQ